QELSKQVRDKEVDRHRAGEGYKNISKSLIIPFSTVKSIIKEEKKHIDGPADMWKKVLWSDKAQNSSLQGPQKKRRVVPSTELHWMSESGVIDAFILLDPPCFSIQFNGLRCQFVALTCRLTVVQAPRRCPLFSLGYHKRHWNYEDEADVLAVDIGFDPRDIPYDVILLDIEHTDSKRYFTWGSKRFPNPACLQRHLQRRSRRPCHPWKWASRPWQRIHIDYTEKDKYTCLMVIDVYPRWPEVVLVPNATSAKTIAVLRELRASYGFLEEIISDNGRK
ncbi:GANC glucosidase, partial [Polyodon spathula]|nr:GANC glucosidase [Polyodon spathula]